MKMTFLILKRIAALALALMGFAYPMADNSSYVGPENGTLVIVGGGSVSGSIF